MKTNEEFFDSISSFYDKMINFDAAIQRRKEALSNFVEPGMHSAGDLGSGTGLDSIALSLLGMEVTGFDISANMIEQAEVNSRIYNTQIQFIQAELDRIPDGYHKRFQLLVSLGNTLANLSPANLKHAVLNAFNMLQSGGKFVMQILNFGYVKTRNERIINITGKDNFFYVRFYDFFENDINFNFLKFNSEKPSQREMITTRLFIYTPDELREMLTEAGFGKIDFFEDLFKKEFKPDSSKDLIISAVK